MCIDSFCEFCARTWKSPSGIWITLCHSRTGRLLAVLSVIYCVAHVNTLDRIFYDY